VVATASGRLGPFPFTSVATGPGQGPGPEYPLTARAWGRALVAGAHAWPGDVAPASWRARGGRRGEERHGDARPARMVRSRPGRTHRSSVAALVCPHPRRGAVGVARWGASIPAPNKPGGPSTGACRWSGHRRTLPPGRILGGGPTPRAMPIATGSFSSPLVRPIRQPHGTRPGTSFCPMARNLAPAPSANHYISHQVTSTRGQPVPPPRDLHHPTAPVSPTGPAGPRPPWATGTGQHTQGEGQSRRERRAQGQGEGQRKAPSQSAGAPP